jgi:hypothetical protein
MATAALGAAGSVAQHSAQSAAVAGRNRAKLRNFHEQNELYKREVMLDRADYKNNMAVADIEQDQVYQAMIDQWSQTDQQLDKLFAEGDQKIEKAIVEMYKNDYAGTQTGKTAARLAGQSAREAGQYKAGVLHNLMMAEKEGESHKEMAWNKAQRDSHSIYEKVRFAPIHGPTPRSPDLEAKPSSASMLLGIAGAAVGGIDSAIDKGWTPPWKK